MATYIVNAGTANSIRLIAVKAKSKDEAYQLVKSATGKAMKSSIIPSAVDITLVQGERLIDGRIYKSKMAKLTPIQQVAKIRKRNPGISMKDAWAIQQGRKKEPAVGAVGRKPAAKKVPAKRAVAATKKSSRSKRSLLREKLGEAMERYERVTTKRDTLLARQDIRDLKKQLRSL